MKIEVCEHRADGWFYITFSDGTPYGNCKRCLEEISGYKDYFASEMGLKGGKRGGVARAASLTPERRKEIAVKAAKTRWARREIAEGRESK